MLLKLLLDNNSSPISNDVSIQLSLIAAIAAIAAPVITAFLNNLHLTKIKRIDMEEQRKKDTVIHERDILERAIIGIGKCVNYVDENVVVEIGEDILAATAYVDENTAKLLTRFVLSQHNKNGVKKLNADEIDYLLVLLKKEIASRKI